MRYSPYMPKELYIPLLEAESGIYKTQYQAAQSIPLVYEKDSGTTAIQKNGAVTAIIPDIETEPDVPDEIIETDLKSVSNDKKNNFAVIALAAGAVYLIMGR